MVEFIFLIIFYSTQVCYSQEEYQDALFKYSPPEEVKDALYFQQQAKRSKSPKQSLDLLKKALSLKSEKQDDNWVAFLRLNMSSYLFELGNTKAAFSELLTSRKIFRKSENKSAEGQVLATMAKFYERNNALLEATNYYKDALTLQEESGNSELSANVALHLADISLKQNQPSIALNYLRSAIKKYELVKNNNGIARSYVKLAEVYRRQKNYVKGEQLIIKSALPLFRSTGYKAGRIDCFEGLGKIYQSQKRYTETKWFFIQQNTQARALNDTESIIISLINMGKVKVEIADFSLAKRDFNEAENLATKKNDLYLMALVKEAYAFYYKKSGNRTSANMALIDSENLFDSLASYYLQQTRSAKIARPKADREISRIVQLSNVTTIKSQNTGLIIKIFAVVIAFMIGILLILRAIK